MKKMLTKRLRRDRLGKVRSDSVYLARVQYGNFAHGEIGRRCFRFGKSTERFNGGNRARIRENKFDKIFGKNRPTNKNEDIKAT